MSLQENNNDERKQGFSPDAALVKNSYSQTVGFLNCPRRIKDWVLNEFRPPSYAVPDSTPPASIITDDPEIRYDAAVDIKLDNSTFTGLTKPEDLTIVRVYQYFYRLNSDIGCAGIATYGRFPLLFVALLGVENFGHKIRNLLAFRHVAGLPISLNTTIVDMGDIRCDNPSSLFDEAELEELEGLGADDIILPYDEDGQIDEEKLEPVLEGRKVRVYNDKTPIPPNKQLTVLHVAVSRSPSGYPSDDDDHTGYQVRYLHAQSNQADIALTSIIEAYIVDIIANREDTANPPIEFQCPDMYFGYSN